MENPNDINRSQLIKSRLFECIHNGEVENIQLWEIWTHVGDILGLKSPKEHAEKYDLTPQAIYKNKKKIKEHFGYKFLIDNE